MGSLTRMDLGQRIIELTSGLVAVPTHETEEDAQLLLSSWLGACGFACELQEVEPARPNLVARRGDGGTFLCSHIDVHPPHGHPDPFTCRVVGETLVGRGVVDAKGQIAALVAALEAAPDAPALLVITCDEERGGLGSQHLSLPDGPWLQEGGIVLEPTGFRVATAQAGHIDVGIAVSGTPGHAYGEEASGSPITAVLAAVDALETLSFLDARHPLLPRPRRHVGSVRGGEHLWRRPARASAEVALGVLPGTDLEAAKAEVRARLDDLAARWVQRGTSFTYEITDASEPIEVPADLPVAERLWRALGTPPEPWGMPSWTDAGNLLVHHGVPCVVFGAGDLAAAHSDDEAVATGDLVRLAEVLARLLRATA